MDDIVEFIRAGLAEDVEMARSVRNVMVTRGAPSLEGRVDDAKRVNDFRVHAAEMKQVLFEETIRPYLGTAGPTGRIAEQQARIMASMYAGRRGYREEWRP